MMPKNPADAKTVYLVSGEVDDDLMIVEAQGRRLEDGSWSIRKGCFVHHIPDEKVYQTKKAAEKRIDAIRSGEAT